MSDLRRRIGQFAIPTEFIDTRTADVVHMMRDVVVLVAERNLSEGMTKYIALHPDFGALNEGDSARYYNFMIAENGSRWVRIE